MKKKFVPLAIISSLGPVILITVIGLALFAFVFGTGSGFITDIFKFNESDQSRMAVINGIDMESIDFLEKVERLQQNNQSSRSSMQAMNSVWDSELRKLVMQSEYNKLGISVESEMSIDFLKNNLSGIQDFQNENGEFDSSKLVQFIQNLEEVYPETLDLQGSQVDYKSWLEFEKNIGNLGLEETYNKIVAAGVNTTIFEGKQDYFNSNNVVDFKYVKIPFNNIDDSEIEVTNSEVNNYLNENKSSFSDDPLRDLIFVKFDEKPSESDESFARMTFNDLLEGSNGFKQTKDIRGFLDINSEIPFFDSYVFKSSLPPSISNEILNLKNGEVYGPYDENGFVKATKMIDSKFLPENAKVRHILIPYLGSRDSGTDVSQTKEEAKKTADSVLNILKRNRKKFQSLLNLSFDKASIANGGEYEFSYLDGFAPEFRDFSFENRVGSIDVIETVFGYHIIEILSQGRKQKAVKVGNLAVKIETSEQTKNNLYNEVSSFEIEVSEDSFREYSKERGYRVNPSNNIKQFDENIATLGSQREIVKWAFDEETKKGDIKRFNLQSGGYVLVMLTSINDNGMMSYEKSSSSIIPKLKDKKKAEKIIEKINSSNLDEIASQSNTNVQTALSVNLNSPVISGVGNEPSVVGYAMGIDKEVTSSAIIGNSGVFYIFVTDRRKASSLDNYQNMINIKNSLRSSLVRSKVFDALKDKADIEDFRFKFY